MFPSKKWVQTKIFIPVFMYRRKFPIMYRFLTISELFLNGRLLRYGQFNKVAQDETEKLPENSEAQQDAGKGDQNVQRNEFRNICQG